MPTHDLVVLALDEIDAAMWRADNPELADAAHIICANGRGWDALRGLGQRMTVRPTTLILGEGAADAASIGGTEPPRAIRLSLQIAEHRRPAYLKGA